MTKLLLDRDAIADTVMHFEGDEFIIENKPHASVEKAVLDDNARLRNESHNSRAKMRKVASIPMGLYDAWKREFKQKYADKWTWQTFLAMKLNDREFSYLRTSNTTL